MNTPINYWWPHHKVAQFALGIWLLLGFAVSTAIAPPLGGVINAIGWYIIIMVIRAIALNATVGAKRRSVIPTARSSSVNVPERAPHSIDPLGGYEKPSSQGQV